MVAAAANPNPTRTRTRTPNPNPTPNQVLPSEGVALFAMLDGHGQVR